MLYFHRRRFLPPFLLPLLPLPVFFLSARSKQAGKSAVRVPLIVSIPPPSIDSLPFPSLPLPFFPPPHAEVAFSLLWSNDDSSVSPVVWGYPVTSSAI